MSDEATSPLNREIDTKVLVWSTLEISHNCETTTVLLYIEFILYRKELKVFLATQNVRIYLQLTFFFIILVNRFSINQLSRWLWSIKTYLLQSIEVYRHWLLLFTRKFGCSGNLVVEQYFQLLL